MTSLRQHLTLRLLAGGALLLGAAGVALHWQLRRALTEEFDTTLRVTAQSLAAQTEQEKGKVVLDPAVIEMAQFARTDGAEVFLLQMPDGGEIARSISLGKSALPLRHGSLESPEFFDAPLSRAFRCAGVGFAPHRDDTETPDRSPLLEAVLVVGRDRAPLDHALASLRNALLVFGGGTLGLFTALVAWGVRRGLAPLTRLTDSLNAVNADSLATRFPVEPLPAELQPIAARLNELLTRLESAFARERRFTGTAAHELRTPLAELRALAEVNLTTPATDPERTQSWQDALATTRRMESLSLRLLDLARTEEASRVLQPQAVGLAGAVAEAWQPCVVRAAQRGIALDNALPPGLTVRTDPALLGMVLANLCANAADHAAPDAALRVSGTQANGGVALQFQNRAGDLTKADVPHLFERFWRKDAARTDGGHHGLGLALAAEFAALLGGNLAANLSPDGVIVFTLQLPAS